MAGQKDADLAKAILDLALGAYPWTPPTTIYVGLFTLAPTKQNRGNEVNPAVWTNYQRAAVANTLTNWPTALVEDTADMWAYKYNAIAIPFGPATIVGTAPVIVSFSLFDAVTGG